jgi:hypothetical protein
MKYTNIAILRYGNGTHDLGGVYQCGKAIRYQWLYAGKTGNGTLKEGETLEGLAKRLGDALGLQVEAVRVEQPKTDKGKDQASNAKPEETPIYAEAVTFKVEVYHASRGRVKMDGSSIIEVRRFTTLREAKDYREAVGDKWKQLGYIFEGTNWRDLASEDEIQICLLVCQGEGTSKYESLDSNYFYAKEKVANA